MYMYHAVFFDRFSRFPFQKESRAYATAGSRRFILRPLSNQAKSQMPPLLLVIQPIRTGDSGEKRERTARYRQEEHRPFAEPPSASGPPRRAFFPAKRPRRTNELSPARHVGEGGEAARGNVSGSRPPGGAAVRWAAGEDPAVLPLRAVRAAPQA
jgi:hypothetical protein